MVKWFIILTIILTTMKSSGEEYCSLCYVVEQRDANRFSYHIHKIELMQFDVESPRAASIAMDAKCSNLKNEALVENPAFKKTGYFITKKYVDYQQKKTSSFLGYTDYRLLRSNLPSKPEELNCELVKNSKYYVDANFRNISRSEIEQFQKQQDEAHGYSPKPSGQDREHFLNN